MQSGEKQGLWSEPAVGHAGMTVTRCRDVCAATCKRELGHGQAAHPLAPTKLNSRHSWSTNLPSCILMKPRWTGFASVTDTASAAASMHATTAAPRLCERAILACSKQQHTCNQMQKKMRISPAGTDDGPLQQSCIVQLGSRSVSRRKLAKEAAHAPATCSLVHRPD